MLSRTLNHPNAPKRDERVVEAFGAAQRVRLTLNFAPLIAIERRKCRVAGKRAIDRGDIQRVGEGQRIAVERSAADAECRRRTTGPRQRVYERSRRLRTGCKIARRSRD